MKKVFLRLTCLFLCFGMLVSSVGELAIAEPLGEPTQAATAIIAEETPQAAPENPAEGEQQGAAAPDAQEPTGDEESGTPTASAQAPQASIAPTESGTPAQSATAVPEGDGTQTPAPSASINPDASATMLPDASATINPDASADAELADATEEGLLGSAMLFALGAGQSVQVGSSTYSYTVNGAGDAATITGYEGTESALTVPETLGTLPVIAIADGVFSGEEMQSVVINATNIRTIGANAFSNCANLESVVISSGVTSIGAGAFSGCAKLALASIPADTITYIGSGAFRASSDYSLCKVTINGQKYLFTLSDGEVIIDAYLGSDETIAVPSRLAGAAVKEIAADAFKGKTSIKSLSIPEGIEKIGASAFENCSKVTTMTLPDSLTSIGASAFKGMSALLGATIPENVTTVPESAFENCTALMAVELEDGVTTVGGKVFKGCTALANLRVHNSVTAIGSDAFDGCDLTKLVVTLDDNKAYPYVYFAAKGIEIAYDEEITEDLFITGNFDSIANTLVITGYTGSIIDLTIPETIGGATVIAIGESAFANNTDMVRLTIPGTVREISADAFSGCTSLETLVLKSGVYLIGDESFRDCTSLKTVSIPLDSCKSIGETAFAGCGAITSFGGNDEYVFSRSETLQGLTLERVIGTDSTSVVIPGEIGGVAVVGLGEGLFEGADLTSVSLGAMVRVIEASAFKNADKLETVLFNEKLNRIDANAFSGCEKLSSVILPDSLVTIADGAFAATALTEVTIPAGVVSIGKDAFDASKVTSFIVESANTVYIAIDNAVFTRTDQALVRYYGREAEYAVPSGTKTVRQNAFAGNTTLTKITLPDGLTTIEEKAFANMTQLLSVIMPDTVSAIADDAFYAYDPAVLKVTVQSVTGYPYTFLTEKGIPLTLVSRINPTDMFVSNMEIGYHDTVQIVHTFVPEGASAELTYRSSNTSVATVSETGAVYGRKTGQTVITVETENGITKTLTVTVRNAPSKVYLKTYTRTIGQQEYYQIVHAFNSGAAGTVTYASDNETVAVVDSHGLVQGMSAGTANIRVTSYNGKYATCKVTVVAFPQVLTLAADTATLGVGQTYTLTGTLDNGQGNEALEFSVDNAAVASIDENGVITAKRVGFAVITVRAYNAVGSDEDPLTKHLYLAIVRAPSSVSFAKSSVTLGVKQTYPLSVILNTGSAAGLEYRSSKTSVATVSATGVVTAKKAGTAYIYTRTHNGLIAGCKIVVKKAPTAVYLNVSKFSIGQGNSYQLAYKFSSGATGTVTFSSSDTTIATVTNGGLVTAVGIGTAKITVRTHNGKTRSCNVTVTNPPASAKLNDWYLQMGVGQSYQLTGGIYDANSQSLVGNGVDYTFASGDSSIASVSAGGKIVAKKTGQALITLRTYNGKTATCIVQVLAAPSAVRIEYSGLNMNNKTGYMRVGGTIQLGAVVPEGSAANYAFYSSNSRIVAVDKSTGLLYARRKGKVTIMVKTYNGKTAKCYVKVS